MKLKVPFHKQKNVYSCGPACLQMVFQYFKLKKSQKKISQEANTNEKSGTLHKNMVKTILKNKFYCYVNNDSTLHEVRHFIDLGIPVIVNYVEISSNDIHYAVIIGYKKDFLILNDPWNGKNLKLTDNFFKARWFDYHKHHIYEQGIIVISPKKINVGKIHIPRIKKKLLKK
jgi:ABC-type bacteriocin/lantibiotic exporter with double-glycine peptidase domain